MVIGKQWCEISFFAERCLPITLVQTQVHAEMSITFPGSMVINRGGTTRARERIQVLQEPSTFFNFDAVLKIN